MNTRISVRLVIGAIVMCMVAISQFYAGKPHDAGASDAPQKDTEQVSSSGPLFHGDMYATMPQNETPHPTFAEDQKRAQSAATWVRVIFEKESQPKFADLVKTALQKQWNPNLGYQLVFGESQGPLEDAATAVTYRMTVQTHSKQYQVSDEPNRQSLFFAVDLIVRPSLNPSSRSLIPSPGGSMPSTPVPTSWDHLNLSCDDSLPPHFKYHAGELETINRRQLGTLYQDFANKLKEIPAFCFFPDRDFDYVRDLYVWPSTNGTNNPPVDPLEFAQLTKALVSNYNYRPNNRTYLDAICTHLVAAGATNYVAGISTVLCEWLPHLSEDRRQLLATNLSFANYQLMKTLLAHRQGYLLFQTIPEVWNDPSLAYFSRDYMRTNMDSPQLAWVARQYTDKVKSYPVFNNAGPQPKHQGVIIMIPPGSTTPITNHLASAQPPAGTASAR